MFKVLIGLMVAFSAATSFASSPEIQNRPPRYDDRIDIIKACDEAFSYDFQKRQCEETANSAQAVRHCTETYRYDFEKFDCMKELSETPGRPGVNVDILRACNESFSYDFQKEDCRKKAVGDGDAVRICARAFNYDYQRFDCIETARSGRVADYCTSKYKYDFEKFDCLRSNY